ncbi:MAG TPA: MBG domain-containing protein [Cytophagaceae bacterium]|nr:MBG domain-containing protein [Cytophagaceae bacterium]
MRNIKMKGLISVALLLYTTVYAYSAELVNASWSAGSNVAGATTTYTFTYQAVTASPYYAFNTIFPAGFSCTGLSDVTITIDGNAVALSGASSAGGAVIQLRLMDPTLMASGSNVVVTVLVTNASSSGTKSWNCIRTATSSGAIIDEISAPSPIVLVPPVPNAPVATFTSSVTTTGFKAFWNTVASATSYRLDLSTTSDFSAIVPAYNDFNVGNAFSYTLTGLSPGTIYYYRLRATNISGTSGNSNMISDTTNKAAASVILTNLSKVYDGTSKTPGANTSPSGLAITYTYNGSSTPPVNAGSYAVVGTVNDPTYQGSASGTMVIAKSTASVSIANLTQAYDGSPKAVTALTSPSGLAVDFTYDGSSTAPTAIGSYTVNGTINDVNYQGTVSGTLVITQGNATVTLSGLSATYDGSAKAVTVVTSPSGLSFSVTYNGSSTLPINAGTYTVVATINDSQYQGSATSTLVISKASATIMLGHLTAVYDGSAKPAVASTLPSGLSVSLTYDGIAAAPLNAGTYNVVATINDANYQGSYSGALMISKADAQIMLSDLSAQYDGACKQVMISTNPSNLTVGVTYDGSTAAPSGEGSYQVVATINHPNYQGMTSGQLIISSTTATIASVTGEVKIYPNPVADFVNVETSSLLKQLQLIDAEGTVVISKPSQSAAETLDVRTLKKGAYLLIVESASGKSCYHVVLN